MAEIVNVTKRSRLTCEFGIRNEHNQYNCFLNVILQSIWVFPALRVDIQSFCDLRNGGPIELKPLINSLQDFYQNIIDLQREDQEKVHITSSNAIRKELFKLMYLKGEFALNDKADAHEAMDFILTQIHTWMQSCSTPPDATRKKLEAQRVNLENVGIKLDELARISCDGKTHQACFIHEKYFIKHLWLQQCVCGKKSGILGMNANFFAEVINMADLLECYESFSR